MSSDEIDEMADDPWEVIRRADRRHDLPGWTNTGFDKAWHLMQRLFAPPWPAEKRPAHELVAGDVTYPDGFEGGYLPHIGVVAPDRVPAIARDVGSVSAADLHAFGQELRYDEESRRRSDQAYLVHYLAAARSFTADAASRGHGIVYEIG